jgi:hypothetical protein
MGYWPTRVPMTPRSDVGRLRSTQGDDGGSDPESPLAHDVCSRRSTRPQASVRGPLPAARHGQIHAETGGRLHSTQGRDGIQRWRLLE